MTLLDDMRAGRSSPAATPRPSTPDSMTALDRLRGSSFATAPPSSTAQGELEPGADPTIAVLGRSLGEYQKSVADVQRRATPLERGLDLAQTNMHGNIGALDAALSGKNILEGAKAGVRDRMTFGDLLRRHVPSVAQGIQVPPMIPGTGVGGPTVRQLIPAAGFAGDVALDPLTYAGDRKSVV